MWNRTGLLEAELARVVGDFPFDDFALSYLRPLPTVDRRGERRRPCTVPFCRGILTRATASSHCFDDAGEVNELQVGAGSWAIGGVGGGGGDEAEKSLKSPSADGVRDCSADGRR